MILDNKKPVAKSNSTHRYFSPLIPSQFQYASPDEDNEGGYDEGGYNEKENRWHAPSQTEKKNSFLDPDSEFGAVNDATIEALEWENDKQSDFAIKSDNSKHITKLLGWIIDVLVSIKNKAGKTVTVLGNFARIDNSEPEPMLYLGMIWIQKVQGILDLNNNQFHMTIHGKTYDIPTFSKPPGVSEPEQQISDMHNNSDKQIDFFFRLEFYSKIQIISGMKNLENKAAIKKEFIRALDYAEYLKKELI
ncbi:hypothetical protein F8M41_012952 [Gigaspora margarita]|uniref:Uncharacterized protein n=1 Tax=Gigaspora margarita TaxID=4874 RepID=A0A8H3WZ95_GIGMA|nr:hypothetical protein F8M41_012952 [Gigaspora margarita]